MPIQFNDHLATLRSAFAEGRFTLYLGAGVSKANGLPSWEELVQALYFTTLQDERVVNELRPYPNYLFALANWVLKQKNEPLEILIRKIRQWYEGKDFLGMLRSTLYAGLGRDMFGETTSDLPEYLLAQNPTLNAIVECCVDSTPHERGLRSIVTYNYDNLLEIALASKPCWSDFQVVSKRDDRLQANKIPIYHVHGFVPYQSVDVSYDDLVFSEDQYNRVFQDPFFWGNVVQVNQMTSSVGLMIGMSLSDRNTRRLFDAIRCQPVPHDNYILAQRPRFATIADPSPELDAIRRQAEAYLSRFPAGRMKMPLKEPHQIQLILDAIYRYEELEFEKGWETLGINLITFDDFSEIPQVLSQIAGGSANTA